MMVGDQCSGSLIDDDHARINGRLFTRREAPGWNDQLWQDDETGLIIVKCWKSYKTTELVWEVVHDGGCRQCGGPLLNGKSDYVVCAECAHGHRRRGHRSAAAGNGHDGGGTQGRRRYNGDADAALQAEAAALREEFNGHDQRLPLRVYEFHEINFDPGSEVWLIEDLLFPEEVSLIYGPPNCGKTFFALSLAFAVAEGRDWFGHKVRQGRVAYLGAEGGKRINKRIVAWKQANGYHPEDRLPFLVIPEPVDLCHDEVDCQRILEAVGDPVAVLVVETINAVFNGGNENSPEDMGRVLANARRLRAGLCCHLILVHHPNQGGGPRGHTSLPAMIDTGLRVEQDEETKLSTVTMTKQREAEKIEPFTFKLRVVELGFSDGKPVTSCVVVPGDDQPASADKRRTGRPRGGVEVRALQLLDQAIEIAGERPPPSPKIPSTARAIKIAVWREYCYRGGISAGEQKAKEKALNRAFTMLQNTHRIETWDDWVWLR
jgi:hypothetical protein